MIPVLPFIIQIILFIFLPRYKPEKIQHGGSSRPLSLTLFLDIDKPWSMGIEQLKLMPIDS